MELTKDNIYTRMMDLAHQALLSRGLDLLILVFPAPSLQPTYNEFETIMNVVATKSSAEPDLCRAYYHYAKEGHECPTLGRKGFQLRPGFLCLHELRSSRVTTLYDLTRPIIRLILSEIYNLKGPEHSYHISSSVNEIPLAKTV